MWHYLTELIETGLRLVSKNSQFKHELTGRFSTNTSDSIQEKSQSSSKVVFVNRRNYCSLRIRPAVGNLGQ